MEINSKKPYNIYSRCHYEAHLFHLFDFRGYTFKHFLYSKKMQNVFLNNFIQPFCSTYAICLLQITMFATIFAVSST